MVARSRKSQTTFSPSDVPLALDALGMEIAFERGGRYYALCPKHEERVGRPDTNPSWSVDPETGLSHCWSCGYGSSFVGLVMDVLKIDQARAVRWVLKNGLTLDILDTIPGRMDPPQRRVKPARVIPDLALAGFVPPPEKALRSRLVTAEACDHYGVLWCPETRAWVLPIRWPDGLLLGYQTKAGPVVLNVPKRMRKAVTLFGIDQFRPNDRAILVESPLDVVRLYSEGIKGGLSSFGAHVSEEQMTLISECAGSLIVALDDDPAGEQQARKLLRAFGRRLPTYVFNYDRAEPLPGKPGKDPGEMTRAGLYRGVATARHSLEFAW